MADSKHNIVDHAGCAQAELLGWFRDHPEVFVHTAESIARDARRYVRYGDRDHEIPDDHGIYFLIDSGLVIYVGKTDSIDNRLASHWRTKRFDSYWSFGGVPYEWLEYIENFYIRRLRPRLNGRHPVNAPRDLDDVTDQLETIEQALAGI